ncbi:GNAT family N-acetyltransferase [Aestuariicella hydrocarbonica]|uniref:GNAT family N-acetyltransferase n=1 Tax=Pseudomaricurvus hydrocarbonicus TaxID=1470433 RepID=A0A9E5JS22_9GAMM|nr:GNAT family N-acetyltransferase [Aestuariicella hydrocarbonica]NHO65703.1 GNAT family N-acetyltransferase [Aestuariicella hydrocarbonica]
MIIKEINYNSEDYKQTLILREAVLRFPLNLILTRLDVKDDARQFHFGVFIHSELAACVVVKPLPGDTVGKLRQMAVSEVFQGRGLGSRLIDFVEAILKMRGFTHMEMSARQTAVEFYRKLGYTMVGEGYTEQGIPHVKMEKRL